MPFKAFSASHTGFTLLIGSSQACHFLSSKYKVVQQQPHHWRVLVLKLLSSLSTSGSAAQVCACLSPAPSPALQVKSEQLGQGDGWLSEESICRAGIRTQVRMPSTHLKLGCVRACVHTCVRACMRACCVCVSACVHA